MFTTAVGFRTNLLHCAVRMERLALPIAVQADISQLDLLLHVADQAFGVLQVLHIWDEEPARVVEYITAAIHS